MMRFQAFNLDAVGCRICQMTYAHFKLVPEGIQLDLGPLMCSPCRANENCLKTMIK